jgi:alcohol dehydrogenase class IV
MMLPHVVRFNATDPAARKSYRELAVYAGLATADASDSDGVAALVESLQGALSCAGMPSTLEECGVRQQMISRLAEEAATQWTAQFNPRALAQDDFEALYCAAL